jgi:hypothetical protein
MHAAYNDHVDVVRILVERGAKIYVKDRSNSPTAENVRRRSGACIGDIHDITSNSEVIDLLDRAIRFDTDEAESETFLDGTDGSDRRSVGHQSTERYDNRSTTSSESRAAAGSDKTVREQEFGRCRSICD